jgi:cytochrome P450
MSIKSLLGFFRFLPAHFRLVEYFERHFEQCRRRPRPGPMTALVQAEQDSDRLNAGELLAMAFLLLVAGHETTVHLIGGASWRCWRLPSKRPGSWLTDHCCRRQWRNCSASSARSR